MNSTTTTKNPLFFFSFLTLLLVTATFAMTPVNAQQQQGKACPDGFTLSKGKCVKPAEETIAPASCPSGYSFNEENKCQSDEIISACPFRFIPEGDRCRLAEYTELNPDGTCPAEYGLIEDGNRCQSLSYADNRECPKGFFLIVAGNNLLCRNGATVDEIPGQTIYSCNQGTLNTEAKTCTVKPGNNR